MSDRTFPKKKSLGQHFLTSDIVPKWMCDAADIVPTDTVLEIGPGTGVLTREILTRGASVIALEADARAIEVLQEVFIKEIEANRLILIHSDVRELDLNTIGISDGDYKVVANIPYYLSGKLFRVFLDSDIQPISLVFLVQKEVATRIARSEKGSLLSLSVRAFGTPHYVRTVSKGHFAPPPQIDSAIISINGISREAFSSINREKFFAHLHIGFAGKRKQLLGALAKHYDREMLIHIFSTLHIRSDVRGEDLSLEEWLLLSAQLSRSE